MKGNSHIILQLTTMTDILDGKLYLGSIKDVNHDFLEKNNIKCIINVAQEFSYVIPGIIIHKFDIVDQFVNIAQYFDLISDMIRNYLVNGSLLIHCRVGYSRSPTFVLAYLIREHKMKLLHAYHFVLQKRKIMPNPHFMKQLMSFENRVLQNGSVSSFANFIDNYNVKYMLCYLGLSFSQFDYIKDLYIYWNKDCLKTIDIYIRMQDPQYFSGPGIDMDCI